MKRILSIETSGSTCGTALSVDEKIIAEYTINLLNVHDQRLAESIKKILSDCEMKPDELDAVAISSGPGSFTGLRIGAAIAKGLCYGGHPKLIAVPTLTAIAYNAKEIAELLNCRKIVSVVHSHKDYYYYQMFGIDLAELSKPEISDMQEINSKIEDDFFVCGPGANDFSTGRKISFLDKLTAGLIAKYAMKMFNEGRFANPEEFAPYYIQEFKPKNI